MIKYNLKNEAIVPVGKSAFNRFHLPASPWMIIGVSVILLITVAVLAVKNLNRERDYMSRVLSEKGAALIKAVEAGARTGMMGMMWGESQIQVLLEEAAGQPDIVYMAITDQQGNVLAHSDPGKNGKKLRDPCHINLPGTTNKEQWQMVTLENGSQVFEVYRYFRPMTCLIQKMHRRHNAPGQHIGPHMRKHGKGVGKMGSWCFPEKPEQGTSLILAGLDVKPFQEGQMEDMRNTVIISLILLFLGITGFFSLFWVENYRKARQMLQDTSAFADEVVASLPVGLIATGRDGAIAFFNETAEKITGQSCENACGKSPAIVFPSFWQHIMDLLDENQTLSEREMVCSFGSGPAIPLDLSASRIVNENGEMIGNILILKDLTEVRQLREKVRRQEKLAAIGGLAAGVAHEIRNPLSSIRTLAAYFGSKSEDNSEDRQAASVIVGEVDRINRSVTELLSYARPSELNLKTVNINDVLKHSIQLIRRDAKTHGITLHLTEDEEAPQIAIDPDRFSQCLLNLYLNALQATDKGGMLSISSQYNQDAGTVTIAIEDSGCGIASNDLGKIFDPYFTSKPSGTGLGLAIVHKIVEAHEGTIHVKSTSGKGTVFTLSLPVFKQSRRS